RSREIVGHFAEKDHRLRLIDASPVPPGVNGKAHGLFVGLCHASAEARWILTIDADVRAHPLLVRSLIAHATREHIAALSLATLQHLSGPAEAMIHPALLATLVYRFGIPGYATSDPARVQANGQCFFVRRDVLERAGGFAAAATSICEDVTLARAIASAGYPVGFYESEGLASVEMYASWREAWTNWSLPMRDHFARWRSLLGLVEVTVVQALPLWIALLLRRRGEQRSALAACNMVLIAARLGVLVGTARAYAWRPITFWLSPLWDLPIALRLWWAATRREVTWRGRVVRVGDEHS
ncbi:MAG: glycosyl transferase, partial [Chloroflexota bacterium]